MQKKLLSLAIAGALAVPGAAMADVTSKSGGDITIYGKFHTSWDYVDVNSGDDDNDDNTGVFRNSRLGFKGSEDLGNGLKGIWQIETELDTVDNAVQMRNTFVGLQGDNWGKIFFGKHDTPYKMATAKLDIFSDTIADYNNIIGAHMTTDAGGKYDYATGIDGAAPVLPAGAVVDANFSNQAIDLDGDGLTDDLISGYYSSYSENVSASNFNEREPQIVAYMTPNFNGFQAAIARESYQNDEGSGNDNLEGWSAMAMYDQGPFFGSLSYELFRGGAKASTGTDDMDAWKVGLGYSFGDSKISAVYEDINHDASDNAASRDAFWGSFAHKFGANEIKLAYGRANDSEAKTAGGKDGADTWAIGIDHNFSKRTKVYAIYTAMDNDNNGNYGLYTAQNNGDSGNGFYASDSVGNDVDAFSVGIIHNF
jgi:predicted porin